ncbi:MAG: apolipoprotein N-acyltransferase [Paracoccus sp. (in: a-proteobacteria)]|nr:apolipoprotein N-acyltransferase [Paracoccus sp. (in: a-proteobacteria)]
MVARRDPPASSLAHRLCGAALDLALGAAVALGQAPWGLWPLSLLALALIIWRVARSPGARAAFWHALCAGAGHFALALNWIVEPFFVQPEIYGWMAPFALFFMGLGGGLFWAVPGWLAARLTRGPMAQGIGFAALLLFSDWLRGWIFTGFPWALLGHIWIDTPVLQAASQIGAIGLSALTLTAAALPLALSRGADPRRSWPGILVSALLIGGVWAGGTARLATPVEGRGITLRLVQPNAEQALKWDPEWAQIFWERLLAESAAPPLGPSPDAVIWPETAVSFPLNVADEALPVLSAAASTTVLMGIQRDEDGRYYNSLIEVAPDGTVAQIYDKFHLVPFGEYIPLSELMARAGIRAFAARLGSGYSPGPGARVLHAANLPPMQPLICYEAIFPQHLRAVEGAEWLLQATNDAWFGTRSGPYQHLAQARLRAVESGLPLMRAANTGVTAAIDPLGRITASLALSETGHIDAELPFPLPRTIWTRFGAGPVLLLAALALILAAWPRRRA